MNKSKLHCYDTVEAVFSRSAELSAMGLSVPQVSRVFSGLADRGLNLPRNIYTLEQAKATLLSRLGKEAKA